MLLLFILIICQGKPITTTLTQDPKTVMDAYNNEFYVSKNGVGYFVVDSKDRKPPTRTEFWRVCESIEMVEDAFESTNNPIYLNMIGELVRGLNEVVSGTEDWASWNIYNDDIMWGIIALTRSFRLTGNRSHLSQAEIQYNKVWQRGWDQAKGGMYWNTQKQTKNACVNGPASIAGFLLGESTQHTGFQNQGKQAFEWLHANLFNSTTGEIADHQNHDGSLAWEAFTYNQGTFIGSAQLYSQNQKQPDVLDVAKKAAYWAKTGLTGQHTPGVLNDENFLDGFGFKGIFARWCGRYVTLTKDETLKSWLTLNANTAWAQRNSKQVTWNRWSDKTPEQTTSWQCTSSVSILVNA